MDADPPKVAVTPVVEQAFQLAQRAVSRYSSKYSKQRYTLHQHVVLLCLKVRKNTTYRILLDELMEMPRIRNAINLTELPDPSMLCKAFDRLDMAVWRVLRIPRVLYAPRPVGPLFDLVGLFGDDDEAATRSRERSEEWGEEFDQQMMSGIDEA